MMQGFKLAYVCIELRLPCCGRGCRLRLDLRSLSIVHFHLSFELPLSWAFLSGAQEVYMRKSRVVIIRRVIDNEMNSVSVLYT